jgi:GTP-binding protein EngB required for normal cell division
MSKIIPAELRWLQVDNKKVLQQRCFYEWSNEYHWEDIEVVNEIDKTPKEKIQAEIDLIIERVINLQTATNESVYFFSIKNSTIRESITILRSNIKGLELALTHLK